MRGDVMVEELVGSTVDSVNFSPRVVGLATVESVELDASTESAEFDNVSLLSIGNSQAGSTTSSKRSRREQGKWHEYSDPKSARMRYRRDLEYALQHDGSRSRDFQSKLFETIEDSQCESSSMTKDAQVAFIRIAINDAISYYIDSWGGDRKKQVSATAIFDDRIRYVVFVTTLIRRTLMQVGEKWIKVLSSKMVQVFLNEDDRNVGLMATVAVTLVVSYIAGSESKSADVIYKVWKMNMLRICVQLASHRNTNSSCPYIQLQKTECSNETLDPKVEFLFNSMIGSFTHMNPESHVVKYAFLLTAVVHAAIMTECTDIMDQWACALLAMSSDLHKFKISNLQLVIRICDRAKSMRQSRKSSKITSLIENIEKQLYQIQLKRERCQKIDCDLITRSSLKLALSLAQEPNASEYEEDIRALMSSVRVLRSKPSSAKEECYKLQTISQTMPDPGMLHEWTRSIHNEWTVFLKDICMSCQTDKDADNFFSEFEKWVNSDPRNAPNKITGAAFVGRLLTGQRTSVKIFHNLLFIHARARSSPISLLGTAMPMFDLVTRPSNPSRA